MPAVKCCIFRAPAGNREVCQLPHTFHERHRDECVQMQDRQLKINIEKRKHATTDPYCTKFTLSNGILNKCVSNFYFFPSRQIFQVLKHAFLENPPLCDVSTGQKFFWSPESCVAAFFVSFSGKLKLSLFLQEASNRGLSVLELNKKTYIKTRSEKNVHNPEPLRHQRDAKPEVIVSSSFSTLQQSTQTLDDRQTLCIGGRWGDELTSSASQHPVQTGDITLLLFVVRVLPHGVVETDGPRWHSQSRVALHLWSWNSCQVICHSWRRGGSL